MAMDYVKISAYNKAWEIENRIYGYGNLRLIKPIYISQLIYFALTVLAVFGLGKVFPVFSAIPWALRFLVLPFVAAQFLHKKKLDGKAPQRYLVSWLRYQTQRGQSLTRFAFRPLRQSRVRLCWYCGRGRRSGAPAASRL